MDAKTDDKGKCPFSGGSRGHTNRDWWPDTLDISKCSIGTPLCPNPMGKLRLRRGIQDPRPRCR